MQTEELHETQEGLGESIEDLSSHVGEYVETFYKLTLVRLTKKVTSAVSAMVGIIVLCTVGSLVLLFSSFALAWWLGTLVNSVAGGFLIVAGFWALVMTTMLLIKKPLLFQFFRNKFIEKFYE